MSSDNGNARVLGLSFAVLISCLGATAVFGQNSEAQRSELEEAERQREIARIFAANARQIATYDLSGRELGTLGDPAF